MPNPPITASKAVFHWPNSEMGRLCEGHAWAVSLGDMSQWSSGLKSAVALMMRSGFPMFAVCGPERILLYNDAYIPILGDKHPRALGRPFWEVWPEVRVAIEPVIEAAFAGEESYFEDLEVTLVRGGVAQPAWFTFSYGPIVDDGDGITVIHCICVETTRSVRSERVAREAQERQHHLFEQAPGFICILRGSDHVYEFVNEAYKRLFDDRRYVGRSVRACFPELEGQGFFELLDGVYQSGERYVAKALPAAVRTSDGRLADRLLDFVYEPIRDANGRVTGIFCEGFDVTAEVRQRMAQEREDARLRFLNHLNGAVTELTHAEDILATTTSLLGQHLSLSCCAYADMDPDQDGFTIRGDWSAPGSPSIVGHYSLAAFGELAVSRLGAGQPLVIGNNLEELAPEAAKTFQDIGITATVCMPLIKDGRLAALMAAHDNKPRAWTEEELTLIREVTTRSWAHVARVGVEAELRASRDRFRAAVQAIDGVLWTNDPEGRMTGEQPGWTAITGQVQEEYAGYGWSKVVHPDDAAPTIAAWEEAVAERKPFIFEHRLRRQDGSWGRYSIRAIPVFDPQGEVTEWVGVHSDITEQREAEERLRESEEQLRLATEAAEVGLWDVDPVRDTLYWPPRVKAMFGIEPDAPVSLAEDFLPRIHPEDRERVAAAYDAATDGARRQSYDVEYRTIGKSDGLVRWVAAKGQALFDAEGRCIRVIGTAMEVTERKRVERQVAEHAHSLEVLNSTGAALAAELDLERIVQLVTDAGVGITGAQFGAFFYNLVNEAGESYTLYALSGVDRSAFDKFPMPRNTDVFAPTFRGEGVVRSDDITADPRYGRNTPRKGMPEGHLPVRSYLAVPVTSRSGAVLGGLFFGHERTAMFTQEAENLVRGVAGQAAIAIDNARLFRSAQLELTQRRRIEAQQRLLINELNHRVKNTLATVQSIVAQTSRSGLSPEEVQLATERRILALSRAHDLLTHHKWEGAQVGEVVDQAMAPFSPPGEGRVRTRGEPTHLGAEEALAVSMALHELATNATKYGSLSVPSGQVCIHWRQRGDEVELIWEEQGGPPVAAPERKGFGSRLLERGLARDLGAEVGLAFRPEGVRCVFRARVRPRAEAEIGAISV